jgi:hypothetical protein
VGRKLQTLLKLFVFTNRFLRVRFHWRFLHTRVIAREKQKEQLGRGAIADGETQAKNASGNSP